MWCGAIALGGTGGMVVPAALQGLALQHTAGLFPVLGAAIDGMSRYAVLLLVGIGAVGGFFSSVRGWLLGVSSVALLPAAAVCEMVVDPTSHNLWPLEFAFYAVLSIPGILGAYIGRGCRYTLDKEEV